MRLRWTLLMLCSLMVGWLVSEPAVRVEAQEQPADQPAEAPVRPGDVDVRLSRAYVRIHGTGLEHEHAAEIRLRSGNVQLGAPQNAGIMVFDIFSFNSDSQESREEFNLSGTIPIATREKFLHHMLGGDVLDAYRYPEAVYRVDSALPVGPRRPDGGGKYQLIGQFTLHGATRPLQMEVLAEWVNGMWRMRGEFNLKQSEFGIVPYAKLTGRVADQLQINGDLWLHPYDAAR